MDGAVGPINGGNIVRVKLAPHEAAVRIVIAVLALEAEEGLKVEGCSRQRMAAHLAADAGS